MTYDELAERTDELRPGALEAWRQRFGMEPTGSLRDRGGALDPGAYCMKLAAAVADGTEVPGYATNQPTPHHVVEAVAAALDVKQPA